MIEAADERRGFREIGQIGGQVDDAALFEHRPILRPRILLKADESSVRVEQAQQRAQRHRTVVIIAMVGIARPHQADAAFPVRTQPFAKPLLP